MSERDPDEERDVRYDHNTEFARDARMLAEAIKEERFAVNPYLWADYEALKNDVRNVTPVKRRRAIVALFVAADRLADDPISGFDKCLLVLTISLIGKAAL